MTHLGPPIKPALILEPGLGPSEDRHTPPWPLKRPMGVYHMSSTATSTTLEDPRLGWARSESGGSLSRGLFL